MSFSNATVAALPTLDSLRQLATVHQTKDIKFFNNILCYVGKKLKDAARIGKFYSLVEIPNAMAFYKNIDVNVTISIIVKKLRQHKLDVRRVGENLLIVSFGQKYESSAYEGKHNKDTIRRMKKAILYDKLGISEKSNPVTKMIHNSSGGGRGGKEDRSSYLKRKVTLNEKLLKQSKHVPQHKLKDFVKKQLKSQHAKLKLAKMNSVKNSNPTRRIRFS